MMRDKAPGILALGLALAISGCGGGEAPAPRAEAPADAAPDTSAAAGCPAPAQATTGPLRIAVVPKGTTHEFWKAIHAGALKAELELTGVQTIWKGPQKEDDREQQINVVETFVNSDVDGIVLAPLDDVAMVGPIRDARAAGVGIVVMDSGVQAEPCTDYVSFVATDNYVGGQKAARRMGEVLGGEGEVILLRYMVGQASTTRREQGFLDTLAEEFSRIQLVSDDQYAGSTSESSYARAESLLNRFPGVDGIFCPNESSTFGMLLALQAAGRAGSVRFVGFDASPKLLQAMEAGEIDGLVIQDPVHMSYTAVKTLVAWLRGEAAPLRIDTGSSMATRENMHEPRMSELLSPPLEKYLD
jgi:ribose transport system substrate-binding protein